MVAYEVDPPAVAPEGGHSVGVAGDEALTRTEWVALPGEHPVAESFRQIEQAVRIGDEGAVTAVAHGGGCAREEFGEGTGEGDRDGGRAAAGQNLTACRGAC
ncbi:hypothetical protein Sfulv_48700 [Streptomyces fulvorobeus]|uniref:Uncharacterized protein n=1 Tax=Streptomyces fulvorobeus TaxID=284028 RepID=A0A7J0CC36_9ACTN|nr:hypothetical protein Sfulv_48700 [Streptomyces fulvorobeus]